MTSHVVDADLISLFDGGTIKDGGDVIAEEEWPYKCDSPAGQWEVLKALLVKDYQEQAPRRHGDERPVKWTPVPLPAQHDARPDYIKMYAWGEWLEYASELLSESEDEADDCLSRSGANGYIQHAEMFDFDDA